MELLDQINTFLNLVKDLSELSQGSFIILFPLLGGLNFNLTFNLNKEEKEKKETKKLS
ncbi:hypothetical protein [Priestia aryabhattai]|uniref:hypothetical protein n=1 Tax=Priestia aryabhattai TaxID=412384 RepID=UPI003D2ABA17